MVSVQWRRIACASVLFMLQGLSACGGANGPADGGASPASLSTSTREAVSSGDLIDSAQAAGEIDAESALLFRVYALFGDKRLPTRFSGAAGEALPSDLLEQARTAFAGLSASAQQALAPYLSRPTQAGASDCATAPSNWLSVPVAAGDKVRIWYEPAAAGDAARAQALARQVNDTLWSVVAPTAVVEALMTDAAPGACDGGDARLDLYLIHGMAAAGQTVPTGADGNGASLSRFVLLNADVSDAALADATASELMNARQLAQRQLAGQASAGTRSSALARRTAGTPTAGTLAVPALASPSVVQSKALQTSATIETVTLDAPVTAGNWLAIGVGAINLSPKSVLLADNQGHVDAAFASTALKYSSSVGTVWRYVQAAQTGSFSLTVNRRTATSATVQVFELADVDPASFLDITGVGAAGTNNKPTAQFGSATLNPNDLLLALVSVRSNTATLTPTLPAGLAQVSAAAPGTLSSTVLSLATTATASFRLQAALNSANLWRMSAMAVRGKPAPPPVLVPVNTSSPQIAVSTAPTQLLLAASPGTWANAPTDYAYRWTRNGADIAGATSSNYATAAADEGTAVAVVVTASNTAGGASATSAAVPVPPSGPPATPTLAFTATPLALTLGQSTTLAWASANTTACAASGAWAGARPTGGTLVVSPQADATFTLECSGAGGAVQASLQVTVSAPPPGSAPSLGAHGLAYHISQGSQGPWLSVPPMATQSGSTMLAFVGKGSIYNLSPPIDNKGNTPYVQVGAIHQYTKWPGEGTAMYAFNGIAGGAGHTVSVNDGNVWDEVSFAAVEVRDGGVIQDFKWNEVLNVVDQTSLSVTTTGPATLVAVWFGDDASHTPSSPVPNNGFTVIESVPGSLETVQMVVASRNVPAAGTYNVTWTTTPRQGAQLYLVAVQKR